jgi:hypothetical protein
VPLFFQRADSSCGYIYGLSRHDRHYAINCKKASFR